MTSALRRHGYSVSYITHKCRCDQCRRWNREHVRAYVAANRERINAQQRERYATRYRDGVLAAQRRRREIISRYKVMIGCTQCGYNEHPSALQFHHLNRAEKAFAVGPSASNRAWDKVKAEIKKCVILCANCHAVLEAGVRGGDAK